jgi:hypothetical protein
MVLCARRNARFEVFHRKDDIHDIRRRPIFRRGDEDSQLQRLIGTDGHGLLIGIICRAGDLQMSRAA